MSMARIGTRDGVPRGRALLGLAATGVSHQQGAVVCEEQLLDLLLALLVDVCGSAGKYINRRSDTCPIQMPSKALVTRLLCADASESRTAHADAVISLYVWVVL